MNHKGRLSKLETAETKQAQHLTWKQFIEIDADGMKKLLDHDPNFAAAWAEFTKDLEVENEQSSQPIGKA